MNNDNNWTTILDTGPRYFFDRLMNTHCTYLAQSELSTFMDLVNTSFLNIMHLKCKSINKNYHDMTNLLYTIPGYFTAFALSET